LFSADLRNRWKNTLRVLILMDNKKSRKALQDLAFPTIALCPVKFVRTLTRQGVGGVAVPWEFPVHRGA